MQAFNTGCFQVYIKPSSREMTKVFSFCLGKQKCKWYIEGNIKEKNS